MYFTISPPGLGVHVFTVFREVLTVSAVAIQILTLFTGFGIVEKVHKTDLYQFHESYISFTKGGTKNAVYLRPREDKQHTLFVSEKDLKPILRFTTLYPVV